MGTQEEYFNAMLHRLDQDPCTDDQTQGPVVTLPYVLGLSEAVRRVLAALGVRVFFHLNTTLRQLLVRP